MWYYAPHRSDARLLLSYTLSGNGDVVVYVMYGFKALSGRYEQASGDHDLLGKFVFEVGRARRGQLLVSLLPTPLPIPPRTANWPGLSVDRY